MTISHGELTYFCDFIHRRSAIVLGAEKEYLIEARLASVVRDEGLGSIDALIGKLRSQPANQLHTRVVEALTTHETTFFRDHHPFEVLRTDVLPALIAARGTSRSLGILCAACSTGQEPYSMAMLLREHFPALASWNVRIVATDLSASILARAHAARFHQIEVNRGLPAPMLAKYFERAGADWQLKSVIRDAVEFRQMNLIEAWPALPRIDLIMLRNVLIYFDVATKKSILARVRNVLSPDGCLFLGAAETTLNIDDAFDRVQINKSVFYKPNGRSAEAKR